MKTIHLIDGEKGGTGKSWFARSMHHILNSRNLPFVGVDADMSNPTYFHVYQQEVQQIPFSTDPKLEDLADSIFQHAIDGDVLVSLPAQVHKALLHWMNSKDVPKMAAGRGITIKKWWVSDGEDDSIHLFLNSLAECDPLVQHVFVQNQGRCEEWEYFNTHAQIQQAIRDRAVPIIQFPQLGQLRRIEINAKRMTFETALTHKSFGILGHAQVSRYLKVAEEALVAGGAFGEPSEAAMAIANSPMPEKLLAALNQSGEATQVGAPPVGDGEATQEQVAAESVVGETTAGGTTPELVGAGAKSTKKGGNNGRPS